MKAVLVTAGSREPLAVQQRYDLSKLSHTTNSQDSEADKTMVQCTEDTDNSATSVKQSNQSQSRVGTIGQHMSIVAEASVLSLHTEHACLHSDNACGKACCEFVMELYVVKTKNM